MRGLLAALALLCPLVLAACDQDGPMEQAGENVDQAVEDAGDAIDKGSER